MLHKRLCMVIPSLFFLISCQQTTEKVDVITFQPSDYEVILFTDKKEKNKEEIYLDALIELKAKYPSEFNQVSSEAKSIQEMNFSIIHAQHPVLLITKNGHTVKELSGSTPKSEIKKHLEMTMEE